jgi:hypothetical protein
VTNNNQRDKTFSDFDENQRDKTFSDFEKFKEIKPLATLKN